MQSNWIILNKKQLNRAQWKPNQMLSGSQGVQGVLCNWKYNCLRSVVGAAECFSTWRLKGFLPSQSASYLLSPQKIRMLWSLTGESVPWVDWRQSEEIRIVQSLESPSLSSVVPWRHKTSCARAYVTGAAVTRNKMAAMIDVKWKKIVFRKLELVYTFY